MLKVTWLENEPASIDVRLPSQIIRRRVPAHGTAEQARDQIGLAIDTGIRRLKAAGVRSRIRLLEFSEQQGSTDFLTAVQPIRVHEAGATGAVRIPDKGGLFGVTEYGDSTFR